MTIGQLIIKIREEKKMLQGELAKKLKISQSFLSDIEKDNRMPRLDLACYIIEVLDLNRDEVCDNLKFSYMKSKGIDKIPEEGDAEQQAND